MQANNELISNAQRQPVQKSGKVSFYVVLAKSPTQTETQFRLGRLGAGVAPTCAKINILC